MMRHGGSKDGYILIAVLGVMVLLTGFVAAGSVLVRSALGTAKVGDADAALIGLTRGGLELTAYQLFVIKASPDLIEGRRIKFAGGTIVPHIAAESGKADLNTSDMELLAGIFAGAGMDARSVNALVAYVIQMRGAPSNDPAPQASPAPARQGEERKRRGFQSVDQLNDVPDLSRAELRALTPLLTVYNPDGMIDIRSATRAVLMSVPGISAAQVETILARRAAADREELDRLLSLSGNASKYLKTENGPAYTVRVEATSARGLKKAINAVIAASKSPNDPFYVFDWWE